MRHFSINCGLLAEGPIVKEKLSFLVGVRSTYSNWVLKLAKDPDIRNSTANFADLVTNLTYNINKKNQLRLFTYYSYDNIDLATKTNHKYDNAGLSLTWHHFFNEKFDMNLAGVYSRYRFNEQNIEMEMSAFDQSYELNHYQANLDFSYRINEKHSLKLGLNTILYHLNNGEILPLNENSYIVPKYLGEEKGIESGIYLSEEWKLSPKLSLYGGLRFNTYSYLGPKDVYTYIPGVPKTPETITDTLSFGNNERIKTYNGLDYRFALTYLIKPEFSVKASFNRLHQNIFMLSNTIAISPTDKWKLADYNIEPMRGNQFSVGLYGSFLANMLEISVEGYYKNVQNLIEYKDGADLIVNEYPEQDVLPGELDAYGIEFMIKKTYGKVNGWINYTYSNASVLVNNTETGEYTNFGIRYPAQGMNMC